MKNNFFYVFFFITVLIMQVSCSSIQVSQYVAGNNTSLCHEPDSTSKVVIYWGTAWRENQKEKLKRHQIAETEIKHFFASQRCFKVQGIYNSIAGKNIMLATEREIIQETKVHGGTHAVLLQIEELGPNLFIYLSPILWETKNIVQLRVRKINIQNQQVEVDFNSRWVRGGPFTVYGAEDLPYDLNGVLSSICSR